MWRASDVALDLQLATHTHPDQIQALAATGLGTKDSRHHAPQTRNGAGPNHDPSRSAVAKLLDQKAYPRTNLASIITAMQSHQPNPISFLVAYGELLRTHSRSGESRKPTAIGLVVPILCCPLPIIIIIIIIGGCPESPSNGSTAGRLFANPPRPSLGLQLPTPCEGAPYLLKRIVGSGSDFRPSRQWLAAGHLTW